jgi:hypothetical protein
VSTVPVADRRRLALDLERPCDRTRREQVERPLLLAGKLAAVRQSSAAISLRVDVRQQRTTAADSLGGEAGRQRQRFLAEVRSVRILLDLPRVVLRPEKSGILSGPNPTWSSSRRLSIRAGSRASSRDFMLMWRIILGASD